MGILKDALRQGAALAAETGDETGETGRGDAAIATRDRGGTPAIVLPDIGEALARLHDEGLGGDFGLMGINDADEHLGAQMPRLQIVQKAEQLADEAGRPCGVPGHLVHAITGEMRQTVQATLVAQKFSRQWLDAYDGGGLRVICASSDGRAADWDPERSSDPRRMPPEGTPCATCPHGKWRGQEPPECSELYTLLLWLHESEEPVCFFIRKTGIKPWRAAVQQIKMGGFRARSKLAGAESVPPNLLVAFVLSAEHVTKDKMGWYEPRFRGFAPVLPEYLPPVIACAAQLAPQFASARSEELEEAGGDVFDEAIAEQQQPQASGPRKGRAQAPPADERNPPPPADDGAFGADAFGDLPLL